MTGPEDTQPGGETVVRVDGVTRAWFVLPRPAADVTALNAAERARADAFVDARDRDAYVAAHAALRHRMGVHLGVPAHRLEFVRETCIHCGGPHGRPRVVGTGIEFSLSHTRGLALVTLSEHRVGADVERATVLAESDLLGVATAVLHPAEAAALAALPAADRPTAFTRCWVRKEAYLKGTGAGIASDLSASRVGIGTAAEQPAGWTLTDLVAPDGFAAAVAVNRPGNRRYG